VPDDFKAEKEALNVGKTVAQELSDGADESDIFVFLHLCKKTKGKKKGKNESKKFFRVPVRRRRKIQ